MATQQMASEERLNAVKISLILPDVNSEKVLYDDTSVNFIFYYKNLTIYTSTTIIVKPIKQENGIVYKESGKRVRYIIRKKNENYGYLFDSLTAGAFVEKVSIDSFLETSLVFNYNTLFHLRDSLKFDRKIGDIENISGDVYRVTMATVKERASDDYDSTYYYFDKTVKQLPFSFSPDVENEYGMTLFRIELVSREAYNKKVKAVLPRHSITFILEPYNSKKEDQIKAFCNHFLSRRF